MPPRPVDGRPRTCRNSASKGGRAWKAQAACFLKSGTAQRGRTDLRSDQLEFFVEEDAPGVFSWGLRDAEGKVVARSASTFADREAATAAMASVADSLPGAAIEEG